MSVANKSDISDMNNIIYTQIPFDVLCRSPICVKSHKSQKGKGHPVDSPNGGHVFSPEKVTCGS